MEVPFNKAELNTFLFSEPDTASSKGTVTIQFSSVCIRHFFGPTNLHFAKVFLLFGKALL